MDRYMNAFKEFKKKFQNGNNIDDKVVTQNLEEDKNKKQKQTKKKKQKKLTKRSDKKQTIEGDHNKGNNAKSNSKPMSSLAKLKQRDPSIKYMKNPLQTPKILDAKKFFSKHWCNNTFNITLKAKTGWRTVAKLSVRGKSQNKHPVIGLFAPKSHRIVRIPNSPAHHVSINKALAIVEHCLLKVPNIKGYDGKNPGGLSYVAFSVQRKDSKVQLVLVFNNNNLKELGEKNINQFMKLLTNTNSNNIMASNNNDSNHKKRKKNKKRKHSNNQQPNGDSSSASTSSEGSHNIFHSIWLHFHPCGRHDNSIFGRNENSWKCVYGNECGVEESFKEISRITSTKVKNKNDGGNYKTILYFPPFVFRQANLDAFENIVQTIRKYLPVNKNVVELYGGVGTIGLNIIDLVEHLSCSDENPYNEKCFLRSKNNLSKMLQDKVHYTTGSATAMVVDRNELVDKDVCIVDPPRKGLDEAVINALLAPNGPERLIYISCGFKAFKRDYEALTSNTTSINPFQLIHAEGHVLFPGADHLETVAIFDRIKK
jgi:23S rRNA (uracil1939-C5)-methyltransferase